MIDLTEHEDDLGDAIRDMTRDQESNSVIDITGTEAHGSPLASLAQKLVGLLPDAVGSH